MFVRLQNYDDNGFEIDSTVLPVDTREERTAAREALRERGIATASVWVGEPGSTDAYKTAGVLRA